MLTATGLLAGCAVGPNYVRPAPPVVTGYTSEPMPKQTASAQIAGGEAQRFLGDMKIPRQWWSLFHSQPLNTLVEQAIKNNPTLQAAHAALRISRENVYAQEGAYYPNIQGDLTPTRQKIANGIASPLNSGSQLFSLHTAQVTVTYTPDVFGGTRRQIESLQASAEAQRFETEAAYVTLTSNVVAAAIQEAAIRGQIAATIEIIRIQRRQLDLIKKQVDLGLAPAAAAVAQDSALAQAEAGLPSLQKQLAQQRDFLTALIGRFPGDGPVEQFDLASLQLPQDLPVSLPSSLIEHRPDVRAAEEQLHAASAQVGVAVANMLPQLTLSADAGSMAVQFAKLFASGTGFWSLSAGLMQPLIDGGTLIHRKRAAEAAYDQAAAQYRSTVIAAFQDVADVMHALLSDADALRASLRAENTSARSLEIARRQVQIGDISYLAQLSSEQAYYQAAFNLVQARANRYADTAALFQALGGGWWSDAMIDKSRN